MGYAINRQANRQANRQTKPGQPQGRLAANQI
jgi:hypothetical protein